MRRWNGWGDDTIETSLPPRALELLESLVGPGTPPRDATIDSVTAAVPESRLGADPRLDTDPLERVRHARGQSLPDWIALRGGRLGAVPDAVARPVDAAAVAELVALAGRAGAGLLPYGGGTSVVGGVTVRPADRPVITVDLAGTAGLRGLDEVSGLATFGAGTRGPALEAALAPHGLTLGHYPQSFEASTVGGWVVTRSAGQQSRGYGRIEELFAGGHLETPRGPFDLRVHPASAAGPDLREVVLGSEGRLGILTDVVVRASTRPKLERFEGYLVPDWDRAILGATTRAVGAAVVHGPRLHPARDGHDVRPRPRGALDRAPPAVSRLARHGCRALPRPRRPHRPPLCRRGHRSRRR